MEPKGEVAEAGQGSRRDCAQKLREHGASGKADRDVVELRSFGDFDENPLIGLGSEV